MDEIIGHLREGIEIPDPSELEIVNRKTVAYPEPKRNPYHLAKGQLVPKMAPFGHGQRYNITGLIHDETGFPTNSTEIAEQLMDRLMRKISENQGDIIQTEELCTEDAEVAIVCYGGTQRAALTAMETARAEGIKCGIFRPVTIWPFPEKELLALSQKVKKILVVEHNCGQLVLEVERIIKNNCALDFLGKWNGTVITPQEILAKIREEEA